MSAFETNDPPLPPKLLPKTTEAVTTVSHSHPEMKSPKLPLKTSSEDFATVSSSSPEMKSCGASRLEVLATMIEKPFEDFKGDFIADDPLAKIDRFGKPENCHFILTSDFLYYCQVPSGRLRFLQQNEKMKVRRKLDLTYTTVKELEGEEIETMEEPRWTFKLLSNTKSFYIRTEDAEIKANWMYLIKTACKKRQRKSILDKIRSSDTPKDLPVITKADSKCYMCDLKFGLLKRPHHCRNCGQTVCSSCSPEDMMIPGLETKEFHRVCRNCRSS